MMLKFSHNSGAVIANYLFALSIISTLFSLAIFTYGCYNIHDLIDAYRTDFIYFAIYLSVILSASIISLLVSSGKVSFKAYDWELFAFKIQK